MFDALRGRKDLPREISNSQLLIDLGNSRLKWALWHAGVLVPGKPIEHRDGQLGDLQALLAGAERAANVWISSTALGLSASLQAALGERLARVTRFFTSPARALGIQSAYPAPEKLGCDRFLAMVGAAARVRDAFLLADAGTALTLDLVDALGTHHGGLIVPGPELMRSALHRGTAGVRAHALRKLQPFADNTSDAVWSGALQACIAVIERSHALAGARFKTPPQLLLSGGAAGLLGANLRLEHQQLPDLVLEGLGRWADEALAARDVDTALR